MMKNQIESTESPPRFFVDENLGKLARLLRACGVDSAFENPVDDDQLVSRSLKEDRVILTRDSKLLRRPEPVKVNLIESIFPEDQFTEVCRAFNIKPLEKAFTRCLVCNALLLPVSRESVLSEVPPLAHSAYQRFWRCSCCRKVYWRGTHHKRFSARLEFLARLVENSSPSAHPKSTT